MRYFGGKQKIAKDIVAILNRKIARKKEKGKQVVFVDLFCGSCNIISKIDPNVIRWANDRHRYLIAMWRAVQKGYELPEFISEDDYKRIKDNKDIEPYLAGFVGFACSFAGKWFAGYARDKKGYGKRIKKYRNYCKAGKNGIEEKIKTMNNVTFFNLNYKDLEIPDGAIVYCDIPYKDSTQYCKKEVEIFKHDEFYKWVEENKNRLDIYISEYKQNIPDGYKIIWEKESRKSIANGDNVKEKTVEVLITPV